MLFDFESLPEAARNRLLLATVLPRPIAWVTTQSRDGLVNAAPFSFFNVFGADPATVALGVGSSSPTRPKDTRVNIRETEEFVVNLVPFSAAEKMRNTSLPFPRQVSEIEVADIATLPSLRVAPPRIAESPVSLECRFMQEIRLGDFSLILGQIVMMHVMDEAIIDPEKQYIDSAALDLIGRMEGQRYTRTRETFEPEGAERAHALWAANRG